MGANRFFLSFHQSVWVRRALVSAVFLLLRQAPTTPAVITMLFEIIQQIFELLRGLAIAGLWSILTATPVGDGGVKFATPISPPPSEALGKELMVVAQQTFAATGFDNTNFTFFRLLLDAIFIWVGGYLPTLTNGFIMPIALGHAPHAIAPSLLCSFQFGKLLHPVPISLIIVLSWLVQRLCLFLGKSVLRHTFYLVSNVTSMVCYSVHCFSNSGVMTIGHQAHIAKRNSGSRAMVIRHHVVATAILPHRTFTHPPELIQVINNIVNLTVSFFQGAKMLLAIASSSIKDEKMGQMTKQVASYATPTKMLQLVAPTCFLPALPPRMVVPTMPTTNGLDAGLVAKFERIVMWYLFPIRGNWIVLLHFTSPIALSEAKPVAQIEGAPSQAATPVGVASAESKLAQPSSTDMDESTSEADVQAFQSPNKSYLDEGTTNDEADDDWSSVASVIQDSLYSITEYTTEPSSPATDATWPLDPDGWWHTKSNEVVPAQGESLISTQAVPSQVESPNQTTEVERLSCLNSEKSTLSPSTSAERTLVPTPAVKLPSTAAIEPKAALRPQSPSPRPAPASSFNSKWAKRALGASTEHTIVPDSAVELPSTAAIEAVVALPQQSFPRRTAPAFEPPPLQVDKKSMCKVCTPTERTVVPTTKVDPPLGTLAEPVVALPSQSFKSTKPTPVPQFTSKRPSTALVEPLVSYKSETVQDRSEAHVVGEAQVPEPTDHLVQPPSEARTKRTRRGKRNRPPRHVRLQNRKSQ